MAHTPPGKTRERVFRFMRDRLLDGRPPTLREVRDALGFRAVESVRTHLTALVEEGRLVKKPGRARGYALPGTAEQGGVPRLVPLLGHVPAGPTDLAVEDVERYLPSRSAHGDEMFALRVRGDSMRDAGIMDGDVVIVRRQPTASSGSIVVALIGDEATVKTLWVDNGSGRGRIELRPENPDYQPIVPDPDEVQILGKVVEVRRFLEGGL
ncbi:MAG: transcriptional repressor LexA [Acidobacteriota bacterium]|jgi:repressor LexA